MTTRHFVRTQAGTVWGHECRECLSTIAVATDPSRRHLLSKSPTRPPLTLPTLFLFLVGGDVGGHRSPLVSRRARARVACAGPPLLLWKSCSRCVGQVLVPFFSTSKSSCRSLRDVTRRPPHWSRPACRVLRGRGAQAGRVPGRPAPGVAERACAGPRVTPPGLSRPASPHPLSRLGRTGPAPQARSRGWGGPPGCPAPGPAADFPAIPGLSASPGAGCPAGLPVDTRPPDLRVCQGPGLARPASEQARSTRPRAQARPLAGETRRPAPLPRRARPAIGPTAGHPLSRTPCDREPRLQTSHIRTARTLTLRRSPPSSRKPG